MSAEMINLRKLKEVSTERVPLAPKKIYFKKSKAVKE